MLRAGRSRPPLAPCRATPAAGGFGPSTPEAERERSFTARGYAALALVGKLRKVVLIVLFCSILFAPRICTSTTAAHANCVLEPLSVSMSQVSRLPSASEDG